MGLFRLGELCIPRATNPKAQEYNDKWWGLPCSTTTGLPGSNSMLCGSITWARRAQRMEELLHLAAAGPRVFPTLRVGG
jgi:hypothetical protein